MKPAQGVPGDAGDAGGGRRVDKDPVDALAGDPGAGEDLST
jgi:hypothetical protein